MSTSTSIPFTSPSSYNNDDRGTPLQSISSLLQTPPLSSSYFTDGTSGEGKYDEGNGNAKGVKYYSTILLSQCLPSTGTLTIANDNPRATLTGNHLSQKYELLTIVPTIDEQTSTLVKLYDMVCFLHNDKYLGVRGSKLGFFRGIKSQAEQWKIIPAGTSSSNGLVLAGQSVLLQNELTGELLSSFCDDTQSESKSDTGNTRKDDRRFVTMYNFQADMNASILDRTMDAGLQLTFGMREKWTLDFIHTPPLPQPHYSSRPFLSGSYLQYPSRYGEKQSNSMAELVNYDNLIQESVLVEEILGTLLGLEGDFICFENNEFLLMNAEKIDPSVSALVQKLLPTATNFVSIQSFIANRLLTFEYGRVSHALCGIIDTLLGQYMDYITHLDDQYRSNSNGLDSLTLSGVYTQMQASSKTISILHAIITTTKSLKGGAVINALEDMRQKYLGDDNAKYLFKVIMEKASQPYMEMFTCWLKDGNLKDPFGEFMIKESGQMKRQDFCYNIDGSVDQWSHWYTLKEENILFVMKEGNGSSTQTHQLSKEKMTLTEKILITGKYWNAIMLCEHRNQNAAQLPKSDDEGKKGISNLSLQLCSTEFSRFIEKEYEDASRTFLNIFMRDYKAIDVLAFMKRYFLLDQGDFFVHFLDMAEEELLQEMTDVSRGRVQNWMTLSIQMSNSAESSSGFEADGTLSEIVSSLTGAFANESLMSHLNNLHAMNGGIESNEPKTPSRHTYGGANKGLTGVEAFVLDFHTVPFPLSLILSRHTILNYQLMFRHLFFAKHVERRLVGTWLDHQVIKEYQTLRKDLGRTYLIRQRMLHFMQNFVYYMMFEVIDPNFLHMERNLLSRSNDGDKSTTTVDAVLNDHWSFLQKTLNECLLSNCDLVKALTKLMTTCLLFSDQMKLFIEQTQIVSCH